MTDRYAIQEHQRLVGLNVLRGQFWKIETDSGDVAARNQGSQR